MNMNYKLKDFLADTSVKKQVHLDFIKMEIESDRERQAYSAGFDAGVAAARLAIKENVGLTLTEK